MTLADSSSRPMRTAREAGYAMPAEWAPHERCWLAWPFQAYWDEGPGLESIRGVYAEVAQAIRRFEPVTMLVNPADAAAAAARLGPAIDVVPMAFDNEWFRDNGPSFVSDGVGGLAGTCWRFNA